MTTEAERLAKSLRIKAGCIAMGEKIAWGSDSALMDQAAVFVEKQAAEIDRLKATPPDQREDLRCVIADLTRQCQEADALLRQALEGFEKAATLDGYTKYSFEPSSIFRHYYASATGDYVDLREFRQHMDASIAAVKQHLGEV